MIGEENGDRVIEWAEEYNCLNHALDDHEDNRPEIYSEI